MSAIKVERDTRINVSQPLRVYVPITAFPVTGGTRTVLEGVAEVTNGTWQLEYLTQRVGPDSAGLIIHRFGTSKMSPWQFPLVWCYFFAGLCKLVWLLHRQSGSRVACMILAQDGVFTGAFAALAGKLMGVRVVCMDHGNITLLDSQEYRAEFLQALADASWLKRLCAPMLYKGYWPSLKVLAWIAARFSDHYLIPGVAGDGVEEACARLNIPPRRVTRFGSMIDVEQYARGDSQSLAAMRQRNAIASDAVVIAIVCRLIPAKGLHVALASIQQALAQVGPEQARRVRIIIAGDGPLRSTVQQDVQARGLRDQCLLWGECAHAEVISLLAMSDIFLYTSTRGACLSMAVLEAMASSCAVIASTRPLSNARLLADGRGIAVAAEDVSQTSQALMRLLSEPALCRQMGGLARDYVAVEHSAAQFRQTLLKVSQWKGVEV